AQVDHFHLVATLGVEPDGGAHQCGDAVDFFLWTRLVGQFALVIFGVVAVNEHGCGNAVDPPGLGDFGLRDARDFVVDDFLGLAAIVAFGRAVGLLFATGQFSAGRNRTLIVVGGGRLFFAGLARAQNASVRVVFIRSLGDPVDVEVGIDLHACVPGTDH